MSMYERVYHPHEAAPGICLARTIKSVMSTVLLTSIIYRIR